MVLSSAEIAQAHLDDRDTVSELLDEIIIQAERTGKIVKQVLQFAREEPSEKQIIDIMDVIETSRLLVRKELDTHGTSIEFEALKHPLRLLGNATADDPLVGIQVGESAQQDGLA